jgi:hypothetical protein
MLLYFSDFLEIFLQNWISCFTLFLNVIFNDLGVCLDDKSLLG